MFTQKEKIFIAEHIQELLESMHSPSLPEDKNIHFHLHINGIDSWSFCDINNNRDLPKLESPTKGKPTSVSRTEMFVPSNIDKGLGYKGE